MISKMGFVFRRNFAPNGIEVGTATLNSLAKNARRDYFLDAMTAQ